MLLMNELAKHTQSAVGYLGPHLG